MKVIDTNTLIHTMDVRLHEYKEIREKLVQLKKRCNDIVNLDEKFTGKGAEAIKGFYQAQIDVVEAWLRLIDRQIAFLNGISGSTEDQDLSGNTIVHLPFLEDELDHYLSHHKEMIASQQDELQRIFYGINDIIQLNVFSKSSFDDHIEYADKERKETIDAVNQLDQDLKSEYILSEGDEQYAIALFQQLSEASRQGNTISPIHFNAEAYKASEVYQLKEQAEQRTIEYLSFKKNQEKARKRQAEIEAEIEAKKRAEEEFAKLNPLEKSLKSFKEIGTDFWEGLEARKEKKLDSLYDFGNYVTLGSFDTTKALYQGMEDRAHVAMNSPYDFVNYLSVGTLDLGNGAINPEESFSKEHWLSSIGLASILAGGAKPVVPKPKTPSLQEKNLILESTVTKANELTLKTKADVNFVMGEVRGGINVLYNGINQYKFSLAANSAMQKIPLNVMNSESVKKVLDRVLSKFSLSGVAKGTDNGSAKQSSLVGREVELDWLGDNYKAIEIEGTVKVGGKEMDISRRVYQKNDIDFDYTPKHPKAKGLSNRELAAKGRSPYVIDKNGQEVQIELHHLIQKESGNMVEIIATTHDDYKKILHGLIKNGDSFRNDEVLDKQFNNFRKKYWKWRSNNLE